MIFPKKLSNVLGVWVTIYYFLKYYELILRHASIGFIL